MKFFSIIVLSLFLFSCTKNNPVLTPIQQAGCAIETAVTTSFSGGVATTLSCTNQAKIKTDLQNAFGNANLCQAPVPQPTSQPGTASLVKAKIWSTVGDVTESDLKEAKGAGLSKALKPQGLVGNIACPIAVSAAMGFLSNIVPSSWGCSTSASASALDTTLVTLCETAVPL
jgi:hypothetical protein